MGEGIDGGAAAVPVHAPREHPARVRLRRLRGEDGPWISRLAVEGEAGAQWAAAGLVPSPDRALRLLGLHGACGTVVVDVPSGRPVGVVALRAMPEGSRTGEVVTVFDAAWRDHALVSEGVVRAVQQLVATAHLDAVLLEALDLAVAPLLAMVDEPVVQLYLREGSYPGDQLEDCFLVRLSAEELRRGAAPLLGSLALDARRSS